MIDTHALLVALGQSVAISAAAGAAFAWVLGAITKGR